MVAGILIVVRVLMGKLGDVRGMLREAASHIVQDDLTPCFDAGKPLDGAEPKHRG